MEDIYDKLRSIEEVPQAYASVFAGYPRFNIVQSEVLDEVLHTDNSLVVSAPTGSGKTAIFEMAIVRILDCNQNPTLKDLRMIYVSPMKALCSERTVDWSSKFGPCGLRLICITGDSDNFNIQYIFSYNLIICTPEKWDILTRRWREFGQLMKTIKLFMIDEVQLLNADCRGPTLEVIVSRMKTIENQLLQNNQKIRFLALSASIANVEDIADWLGATGDKKYFKFSEETRPVRLNKIVVGYSNNHKNCFTFDIALTYRLPNLIKQYAQGKPTLIFCSTRKSVEMTSSHLVGNLNINLSAEQKLVLQEISESLSDNKLKKSVVHGIAIHHAGLLLENRLIIERGFRDFKIPVLVTTSTLAMGVNLPAHLVIIKSTKTFEKDRGFKDYDEIAIFQMIGRAGRIQFDTSGTAIILTSSADKENYERMINCTQPIESNLHKHLTEHLNAEIVLGTITDLDGAMRWVFSTFLYFRAQKCPTKYGLSAGLKTEQIDRKLLEMCQIELAKLVKAGMCVLNENTDISSTVIGDIMAKFYLSFDTMKLFTELSGYESLNQILAVIAKCKEFADVRLRVTDKKSLNALNYNKVTQESIRFKLKGKIATVDMKVNCLIQAILGNFDISDHSLVNDGTNIMRSSERVCGCLINFLQTRTDCYNALLNATILAKCFHARLWENSPYVAKQLKGIGPILSRLLVKAGKDTFLKIARTNPRQIEMILNKKAPFGNQIVEEAEHFPFYDLQMDIRDSQAHVKISLLNSHDLEKKSTVDLVSKMTLLIGDSQNKILLYEQYTHAYLMENTTVTRTIDIETCKVEYIQADFISEDWVGIDCKAEYEFPKPPREGVRTFQTFLDMYAKGKSTTVNSDKKKCLPTVAKTITKPTPKPKKSPKNSIVKTNAQEPKVIPKKSNNFYLDHHVEILEPLNGVQTNFQNNNDKIKNVKKINSVKNIVEVVEGECDKENDEMQNNPKECLNIDQGDKIDNHRKITRAPEEITELRSHNIEILKKHYKDSPKKRVLCETLEKNKNLFEKLVSKYGQKSVGLGNNYLKKDFDKQIDAGCIDILTDSNDVPKKHDINLDSQINKNVNGKDDRPSHRRSDLYGKLFGISKDNTQNNKKSNEMCSGEDNPRQNQIENVKRCDTHGDDVIHLLDDVEDNKKPVSLDLYDLSEMNTPKRKANSYLFRNHPNKSQYTNTPKVNRISKNSQMVKKQLFNQDLLKHKTEDSLCQTPLLDQLLDPNNKKSNNLFENKSTLFSDIDNLEHNKLKNTLESRSTTNPRESNNSKKSNIFSQDLFATNNTSTLEDNNSHSKSSELKSRETGNVKSCQYGSLTSYSSKANFEKESLTLKNKSQDKEKKRNELKKAIIRLVSDSPTNEMDIFEGLVDDDMLSLIKSGSSQNYNNLYNVNVAPKKNDIPSNETKKEINIEKTIVETADSTAFSPTYMIKELIRPTQFHKPITPTPFGDAFSQNKTLRWRSPLVDSPANKFSPKFTFSPNFPAFNYFNRANVSKESISNTDEHSTTTNSFANNMESLSRQNMDRNLEPPKSKKKTHFPLSDNDCEVAPTKKLKDDNLGLCYNIPEYQNAKTANRPRNRPLSNSSQIFSSTQRSNSNANKSIPYEVLTGADLCARLNFSQTISKSQNVKPDEKCKFNQRQFCESPDFVLNSKNDKNDKPANITNVSHGTVDENRTRNNYSPTELPPYYIQQRALENYENSNYAQAPVNNSYPIQGVHPSNPNFGPVVPYPRYPHLDQMYHPYSMSFDPRFVPHYPMPRIPYTNPYFQHDVLNESRNQNDLDGRSSQNVSFMDLPHTLSSQFQVNKFSAEEVFPKTLNDGNFEYYRTEKNNISRQFPQVTRDDVYPSGVQFANNDFDTDQSFKMIDQRNRLNMSESHSDNVPHPSEKEFYGPRILPHVQENLDAYHSNNLVNFWENSNPMNSFESNQNQMPISNRTAFDVYQTQPQNKKKVYDTIFNNAGETILSKSDARNSDVVFNPKNTTNVSQVNRTDVRKMFAKSNNGPRFEHKQFLRHKSFDRRVDQKLVPSNQRDSLNNARSNRLPMMPLIERQDPIYTTSNQQQNNIIYRNQSQTNQMPFTPKQNSTDVRYPQIFQECENDKQFVMNKFLYS